MIDQVDRPGRSADRRDEAERIWTELSARDHEELPFTPIDEAKRVAESVDDLGTRASPYDQIVAVDAGSLNPTSFQNGLVVDLAHAAMATTPTDVSRHRRRTIVAVVHGPPAEIRSSPDWTSFDNGYGRSRLLAAPNVDREEDTAVHTLALASAEIDHALTHLDPTDELVIMDGSVYPASVLHWEDRDGELKQRLYSERTSTDVIERSARLVDACFAQDTAIVGFVKNWTARGLISALREAGVYEGTSMSPWPTDYALFQQLLSDVESDVEPALRWTSWFRSDLGVGSAMATAIDRLGIETEAPSEAFELATMVVFDPRENVVFRVEAPMGVVADSTTREAVTAHILTGIAIKSGPPPTLAKADSLASIGRHERRQLRQDLAVALDTRPLRRYDDVRWPDIETTEAT